MKRMIVATTLVFCFAAAFSLTGAAIQPVDIVGVWLLNEGSGKVVVDMSGNGHDGEVVQGDGNAEWVAGKFNKGLDLQVGGHVVIPHHDSLNLEEFTISIWVKVPQVLDTYQFVVGKEAWPDRNYSMWILPGVMTFGYSTPGAAQDLQVASADVVDNQWHHVVGTFDGTKLVSYVDGVLSQQRDSAEKPATCNAPIKIGVQPPDANGPLTGAVDEFALFRRGLTEDEVLEVMDGLELRFLAVHHQGKLATRWGSIKSMR